MKKNLIRMFRNEVSGHAKSGFSVKTFLVSFFVFATLCSFKAGGAETNPNPFYAFPIFTYDYTDLNGNQFGSIEIDFHDDNWDYPPLDAPIRVHAFVGPQISSVFYPQWDVINYCTTNPYYPFATDVPMNSGSYSYVCKLSSPDGDFTPDPYCAY